MTAPKIRCAVYTRKSSEEGLDQDFNSLDAQYEACKAYIASQRHEGWVLARSRYDDGGVSGGTLERPALQRLLHEIDAGRIGMVVVYKIDRLTRALSDFAKLVDRFDDANCSFVSVTQAFNTASSMGRLTLNVLLSFAQFEREVTAERIRDKIAASKKKGLWMGGNTPLGYDPHPDPAMRSLVVNTTEAETVRTLFDLYERYKSLSKVRREADRLDLCSKVRPKPSGGTRGGTSFSNGQVQHLLRNPVYIGQIRHKDRTWPGKHPPIIDEARWHDVQSALDNARRPRRGGAARTGHLTGKLRDETGDLLTPTHTTKNGRRHHYYVSNRLISGGPDSSGWRLPAQHLEAVVAKAIVDHLDQHAARQTILAAPDVRRAGEIGKVIGDLKVCTQNRPEWITCLLANGRITSNALELVLDGKAVSSRLGVIQSDIATKLLSFTVPFALRRRGVEMKIVAAEAKRRPDLTLLRTLAKAHYWTRALRTGRGITEIAKAEGHSESFIRTRAQLAFLSPRLQQAILAGTQPAELTVKSIVRQPVPLDWDAQDRLYGITSG